MEGKPIKRSRSILHLSREHHYSLLFCWKLRQGIKKATSLERMTKYVSWFWANFLLPHFHEEEKYLFKDYQEEKILRARKEHEKIKAAIQTITLSPATIEVDKINELADLVDNHVRFEERELFPFLESYLSDVQLREIEEILSNQELIKDDYSDEFWK